MVRVAVNVSPAHFAGGNLPGAIAKSLDATGLAADRLEIEIGEAAFLACNEERRRTLTELKSLGVRLTLDEAGLERLSLAHLQEARFDRVKFHRTLVQGGPASMLDAAALIDAVMAFSHRHPIDTTAEGIEEVQDLELFRRIGCSHLQGFVFGQPYSSRLVVELLTRSRGRADTVTYRPSRVPRKTVFVGASLTHDENRFRVIVRNISTGGAMIETTALPVNCVGDPVLVEIDGRQRHQGAIRWSDRSRAGVEFAASTGNT